MGFVDWKQFYKGNYAGRNSRWEIRWNYLFHFFLNFHLESAFGLDWIQDSGSEDPQHQ